jgi:cellulose synthase/poly-beta-1,6-N-acetylglucosamine synthase-like glycosyltransferase
MRSVHITPGAFSAYRKSFFDKYGGYDVGNITEDLEMSLRIQSKGYQIENAPDAVATTLGPGTFMSLLVQRRRWYTGLLRNMKTYIHLLSPKYGDMGLLIMPVAWISIFFSVYMLLRSFSQIASQTIHQFYLWNSVNFDMFSTMQINLYLINQTLFTLLTKPYVWFLMLFIIITGCYLFFAWKQTKNTRGIFVGYPIFVIFFALLFGFWWLVSIIYTLFNRKVKWR